ncbi:uncharacterized protein LOC108135208 [Drosophila elegans]|uniref:uncharacterized protein LOC108135208 n=1 Tax=Drosophila elegans TaxID=30023 RepID=UPI0007E5E4A0|nr:uncharacterized protein LOC108135208 [Drosophila elegans]
MNETRGYSKEFGVRWLSEHSDDDYLPTYSAGSTHDGGLSRRTDSKDHTQITLEGKDAISEKVENQEPKNTFWICVSDYELDRAYIVYRFFHDIGNIVAKNFTQTNRMYLKYFSMVDCQIALSYNGQKIGYGGDIRVQVKVENPVTENVLIEALEHCSEDDEMRHDNVTTSTMTVTIEVEDVDDSNEVASHHLEMGQSEEELEITHKKVSLVQWFKEKLSYVFYFY